MQRALSADEVEILDAIARHAAVRYRPSSSLALLGLVAEGAGGFAVITHAGRRELHAATVVRARPPLVDVETSSPTGRPGRRPV